MLHLWLKKSPHFASLTITSTGILIKLNFYVLLGYITTKRSYMLLPSARGKISSEKTPAPSQTCVIFLKRITTKIITRKEKILLKPLSSVNSFTISSFMICLYKKKNFFLKHVTLPNVHFLTSQHVWLDMFSCSPAEMWCDVIIKKILDSKELSIATRVSPR